MFYLRYHVTPTATHPEHGVLGEGYVCCWIERETVAEAEELARTEIVADNWDIIAQHAADTVTEADYPDAEDEDRDYYQQALTDGEVFVFHTSPRHPAYWVQATAQQATQPGIAEAHFLLLGDALVEDGEDVAVPDFWNEARREFARNAARTAIAEAGWTLIAITADQPCGPEDLPEEMQDYYDATEEDGSCLVFVNTTDGEAGAAGENPSGSPD